MAMGMHGRHPVQQAKPGTEREAHVWTDSGAIVLAEAQRTSDHQGPRTCGGSPKGRGVLSGQERQIPESGWKLMPDDCSSSLPTWLGEDHHGYTSLDNIWCFQKGLPKKGRQK